MVPPLKIGQEFSYKKNQLEASLDISWNAPQNRVDKFETKTNSFWLTSIQLQKHLFKGINHRVSFAIENIFNVTYQNHLSRLKDLNVEPGRNFKITYKAFM
jgi:iron complex outermembrane receptor protein